jgi:hypothetical protein
VEAQLAPHLQRVQLGRRNADVDGTLRDLQEVEAGVVQERLEALAEVVVQDRPVLPTQLVLSRRCTADR